MKRIAGNGCCDGRDVLPQDRGPPRVCRSIVMAVQLCPYEGLAARDPSPNASASPSPTATRCSECADPALLGQMALGFRGSLNERARGMPLRRPPASARRRVSRSGRAGSIPKQSTKPARRPCEPPMPITTARPVGARLGKPKACSRLRRWRGDASLRSVRRRRGRRPRLQGLTGEDWKACEALSELCREDAEPPRSTPSASDPSPSRRGRKEGSCAGGSWRGRRAGTARRRRRSPRGLAGKGGGRRPFASAIVTR